MDRTPNRQNKENIGRAVVAGGSSTPPPTMTFGTPPGFALVNTQHSLQPPVILSALSPLPLSP